MKTNEIHFEKAAAGHQEKIFAWLDEPHMREFWDNSQAHRDDILDFIHGRRQRYFYGTTKYWVAYLHGQPFAFILSDEALPTQQDLSDLHRKYMSGTGHTIILDFGIGDPAFLGKGLAAPTLQAFMEYYRSHTDPEADTFFIDPDVNNPRAIHVYAKAGFELAGDFVMSRGEFKGQTTRLMVRSFSNPLKG